RKRRRCCRISRRSPCFTVATTGDCSGISLRILRTTGPTKASPIEVARSTRSAHDASRRAKLTMDMRLRHTCISSLSICAGGDSPYNEVVTIETKRPFILFGGFAVLFVAFVALLLRVLPGERTPFDYMVAGTFATALALVVMFVVVARQRH